MISGAAATAIKEYSYTSGVTQFQFTPVVLAATDMQVIYVGASGTELIMTNVSDYTVTNVGTSYSSSTVTLTAVGIAKLDAVGGTVPVTCQRVMSATQDIDYIAMDAFPAENTEAGLDKLTLLIAQASAGVVPQDVRSLQFPASDPDSLSPILPDDGTRANKVLSFDVNGEPTVTDLGSGTIGGMTGPASQVEGNLALYDAVNGVLKQDNNIHESLFKQQTLNWLSTTTWDSDLGHIATVTVATGVTTSPTFNITNIKPGKYSLIYIQDATGGAEPVWGAMVSGNPTVKTGANDITTLEFVSDGTKLYAIGSSTFGTVDTTGSIKAFAYLPGVWTDTGHLYCNGQVVSRTTYANLFAKLGTTYNTGGEAATDFRLPDYRGYVLRGLDPAAAVDPDGAGRTLGDTQADAIATHTGDGHIHSGDDAGWSVNDLGGTSGSGYYIIAHANSGIFTIGPDSGGDTMNITTGVRLEVGGSGTVNSSAETYTGPTETRMKNISVHYGIKF